ncbi:MULTISPECIES: tetratricopeptide repeat protein [Corallococcus]|uniref:tetratricopeptide repeat protein n=1 Tax=Corallococcus TaxID=83461 RepID=UPI00117FDC70|nr:MULTISPECIES: tetratricopeptide repeat protein [Corallococcus]NBD09876.1 tetratricopeptide repeat protein [Corallococcus silvisoli]TSC23905.1 tetratricopeptide repeat protein [Corallococcus sp. Z5C101001]
MTRGAPRWAWVLTVGALAVTGCRDKPVDHMQRARDAIFEKRPDEALVEYRKAYDMLLRDESAEALVMRARALKGAADVYWLEQRKVKEAVSVYRQLIQQCPESPEALDARIILAELLRVHYRDLRGAIDQLTAALHRNPPQSAELQYQVAKLYFELADYPQCELEAKKLPERFAASAYVDDALFLQAQALAMVDGKRQEALRTYADLRTRFPDSELAPYALFEMGKLRADAGDNEKAIETWVEALKTHPEPALVQDAIARARRRLANLTPEGIGQKEVAFDRSKQARTSVEAMGGSAEEAAHDRGD